MTLVRCAIKTVAVVTLCLTGSAIAAPAPQADGAANPPSISTATWPACSADRSDTQSGHLRFFQGGGRASGMYGQIFFAGGGASRIASSATTSPGSARSTGLVGAPPSPRRPPNGTPSPQRPPSDTAEPNPSETGAVDDAAPGLAELPALGLLDGGEGLIDGVGGAAVPAAVTPEPGTLLLIGGGLGAIALRRRRARKHQAS